MSVDLVLVDQTGLGPFNLFEFTDETKSLLLLGMEGDDTIKSGAGNDHLYGGIGTDVVIGGTGADRLYGNGGNDTLIGAAVEGIFDLSTTDFSVPHPEWFDGEGDYLSGGAGDDILISAAQFNPFRMAGVTNGQFLLDRMATRDAVDGRDDEYTLHLQVFAQGASEAEHYVIDPDTLQAGLDAGPNAEGVYTIAGLSGTRVWVNNASYVWLSTGGGYYEGQPLIAIEMSGTRDLASSAPWRAFGTDVAAGGARMASISTVGEDMMFGGNGADEIYALGGDDTVVGWQYFAGEDFFNGGEGTDIVDYSGTSLSLTVDITDPDYGFTVGLGTGNEDVLFSIENILSGSGDDTLTGSSEANALASGGGDDQLAGGLGDDVSNGGTGSDTYVYALGDGFDLIEDWGDASSIDVIELGSGISSSAVTISRGDVDFWDLKLGFSDGGSITVKAGFIGAGTVIEMVQFAGGTTWTAANIRAMYFDHQATSGNDYIHGFIDTADIIVGRGGNDELYGYTGDDTLNGNGGNDVLFGNDGADRLIGEAGDDFMIGGEGTDTFAFGTVTEGTDWIDDFVAGQDRIDLSAISSINDFTDVLTIAEEWGGTTWLNFDQSNSIRLQNVTLASLTEADFVLA